MEISQQQRRPTIGQFAQQLNHCGLEVNAQDLADMLWLAQFIESEPDQSVEELEEQSQTSTSTTIIEEIETSPPEPALNLYSHPPQPTTTEEQPSETKSISFPVPAAPAIRTRIDLARSLRPLMRKVPSRTRVDLDEEATVTQLAETGICVPVVRSTPERWLDLDLVVESSKTTVLWERTITELQHLMEYQGAFRTVRTWLLQVNGETVQLLPRWHQRLENRLSQRPRSPRELIDPSKRRLILYVSDCTSKLWRQGIIHETLWQWSDVQPLALVQMLPERLWSRTALSDGYIVKLGAMVPGLANSRLNVEGLPDLDEWDEWDDQESHDKRKLTLPIVTLDPNAFQRWARVVAGVGEVQTPGRVFELGFVEEMTQSVSTSPKTAQKRVEIFRATASRTARQLAGLMAATPVSLPVIDLLREEFLPNAQQVHVAEVLLSGLLQRCEGEESIICEYEFFPGVRELLVDGVPIAKTTAILDRLSEIIAQKAGRTLNSFEAFLTILQNDNLGESALPFATVGLEVLKRLGGDYAKLAERQALSSQTLSTSSEAVTQTVDFPLQEQEYEVAQVQMSDSEDESSTTTDFPPLKTFEYEPAIITNILEQFEFETATISRRNQKWIIRRRRLTTWGYTEQLSDEIGLEMISIPGGTFVMGTPENKQKARHREQPQHKVTLQPFYMGRYAVTQAQWRVVADYPAIDRKLDPDPSRFKGDNRPVEQVNWKNATEFCKRLSVHTGLEYRLPSEAEWEYACRAGTTTLYHFGQIITTELANFKGNRSSERSKAQYQEQTMDVGSFPANEWGLHEMHGNVWEWCQDDYHNNYKGAPDDGSAWIDPDHANRNRVLRGGSWFTHPGSCRSAYRFGNNLREGFNNNVGFRVVCVVPMGYAIANL
ncbi:MAG: formylglycine-generating enzyme family protein [Cyanobacteria bacterium J06592_8]